MTTLRHATTNYKALAPFIQGMDGENNHRKFESSGYMPLVIIRTYSDKTSIETLAERFDGKERHKAIKRFNQLKKERPGIETVMNIERRSWER